MSALVLVNEKITDAILVNAGISEYISINEVAETVCSYIGWEPNEINHMTDKPVGVRHRAADTSRAEELRGWEPQYGLEDGLAETIDWYVGNRDQKYVRDTSKRYSTNDNRNSKVSEIGQLFFDVTDQVLVIVAFVGQFFDCNFLRKRVSPSEDWVTVQSLN